MVLQHAHLEIREIPAHQFSLVSDWIRTFFLRENQSIAALCKSFNYSDQYVHLWIQNMQYESSEGKICNSFPSYAHPLVFEPMLRALLESLSEQFPELSCSGFFRLFNSNWGYSLYPFQMNPGIVSWSAPNLARQQPESRAFWGAMGQDRLLTLEDLFTKIYAPLTPRQRSAAFDLIYNLTDHHGQELSPYEGYDFDDDGFAELHSLVEFACWYFREYAWDHPGGIPEFFRNAHSVHRRAGIPFSLPRAFKNMLLK